MKKYFAGFILILIFSFNYFCSNSPKNLSKALIFRESDSIFVKDSVKYTNQVFWYGDSIISTNHYSFEQLVSIQIFNRRLFEMYRDSMGLQSNRLIGFQIFAFRCSNCHDFRDWSVVKFADRIDFVPFIKTHLTLSKDTLNLDEINFIKDYLKSVKN